MPSSCCVAVRPGDEQEQDEREHQREDEEAALRNGAQQLVADVGDDGASSRRPPARRARRSSAVSSRKASSRAAPWISMSCDVGVRREQGAHGGVGVGARAARWCRRGGRPRTTPGRSARSLTVDVGQRRPDRAPPDSRLDLRRRSRRRRLDAVGHQHDAVGVGVGLLEVVGGEDDGLAARRRSRASSPRTPGGPRRRGRRSARRARAGRGFDTRARAKRTRCVCPPDSLLRAAVGDVVPMSAAVEHVVDRQRVRVQRRHHREQLADRQVADQRAGLQHGADQPRP